MNRREWKNIKKNSSRGKKSLKKKLETLTKNQQNYIEQKVNRENNQQHGNESRNVSHVNKTKNKKAEKGPFVVGENYENDPKKICLMPADYFKKGKKLIEKEVKDMSILKGKIRIWRSH